MSEIKNGGPAFPLPVNADIDCAGRFASGYGGISKREWFAGMALQGMMDNDENVDPEFNGTAGKWGDVVAKRAYQFADAMLRAGKKDSPCQPTGVVGKSGDVK